MKYTHFIPTSFGDFHLHAETNTSRLLKKLPAGIYTLHQDPRTKEQWFTPEVFTYDKLVHLPDTVGDNLLQDIRQFFKPETRARFERYNFLYKRGLLLHGKPGTGKSCIIYQLIEEAIKDDVIVLWDPAPNQLRAFVSDLRQVEGTDRRFLVIWEEFDSVLKKYGESEILQILDGGIQINNIVYLATTNYINKLPPRITNRPSRFARCVETGPPNVEARRIFIRSKIHENDQIDIEKWVAATQGMTLDHIKDLIVSVLCLQLRLQEAINRIKELETT